MIIGLFLRHIKAYKGINFIPIGHNYNFVSYIGENGVGKSSILEALDSFFNNKSYSINKSALSEITTQGNEPFIAPIFLIPKSKVSKKKKEFELLSNFFWSIEKVKLSPGVQGSMNEFFKLREKLKKDLYSSENYYLIVIGESFNQTSSKLSFASFFGELELLKELTDDNLNDCDDDKKQSIKNSIAENKDWKALLSAIKDLYSYVYIPVEIALESFTKIETDEMQKIFDKKLKDEILSALDSVSLVNADGINTKLELFVSEIEETLDNEYCYSTGQARNNTVTKSDLANKILETYFQKRNLHKIDGKIKKKVSELSAGEKRQALISIVHAFLKRDVEREKIIIIGIDEPENSLHTTLCYDQFEKLREVAKKSQVFITTHWYGFLPIVSEGFGHFLSCNDQAEITFDSYDLCDYRAKVKKNSDLSKNRMPNDFILKSTNDLVQSIFYSIANKKPYNWIICEGITEKIYFEFFFKEEIRKKKLRILPMGGAPKVIRLYEYLEVPINNEIKNYEGKFEGRIYCLIDTDQDRLKFDAISNSKNPNHLVIKRLSNKGSYQKTELLNLHDSNTHPAQIENSLNPLIFQKAILELKLKESYQIRTITEDVGNTDFIENFKNLDLRDYFKEEEGNNKIIFAKKYVEVMEKEQDQTKSTPSWIKEIKKFFK